jgi:hypothetical protein
VGVDLAVAKVVRRANVEGRAEYQCQRRRGFELAAVGSSRTMWSEMPIAF